jgi:hypothetical protein
LQGLRQRALAREQPAVLHRHRHPAPEHLHDIEVGGDVVRPTRGPEQTQRADDVALGDERDDDHRVDPETADRGQVLVVARNAGQHVFGELDQDGRLTPRDHLGDGIAAARVRWPPLE